MYKPAHPNQSFQQYPSSNSKVQSSRNTSGSPVQRLAFQANPYTPQQQKNPVHPHADVEQWKKNMSNLQSKTQMQGDQLDWKSQRIAQQEEEIKFLKFQLDISQQQLKTVQNTLGQVQEQYQQLQSQTDKKGQLQEKIFNTTSFEIVVYQKSIEQLESLKSMLVKRKEKIHNEIDQENLSNSQMIDLLKELKLKISVLEEQNQKLKDENSQFQVNHHRLYQQSLLLFPKAEFLERKARSKERRNSSEIKQIKLKASPDATALRSPKKGINH